MQNAAQFWDKAASKYAKSPIADIDAYSYTLDRTRSYLSSKDTVLEVGCGTGSTALLLARDTGHITASDVSGNMIRIGSQKAQDQAIKNVEFVQSDLLDIAVDGGPYDAVLAFNILHLLEDTSAAIAHINNLLKPGGTFISKTVCQSRSGTPIKFQLMMMILPLMQRIGKAPFVKLMEIKELEDIVTSGGFKIVETGSYPASPPSRYIVARKP